MKNKILLVFSVLVVMTTGILYAATPYEIVSDLTGLTYDNYYELRSSGLTMGQIAEQYGVYDEFYDAMLLEKEARLEVLVSNGVLTQEEAEAMLLNCDPSNPQYAMRGFGMGYGRTDENGTFYGGMMGRGAGYTSEDGTFYGGMMGRGAGYASEDGTTYGYGMGARTGGFGRWSNSNN